MKRQWTDATETLRGKRCVWTEAEDQVLLRMARKGKGVDWAEISKALEQVTPRHGPPKTAKQCRERWHNRVNPTIKQGQWTDHEVTLFFELYQKYGPKWSKIAIDLPGRTDNTIKNFFYCRLRKMARRIKKGIFSDDMKSSPKDIEHTLYLIRYLRSYYTDQEDPKLAQSDKYIAEMVQSAAISLQKIDAYLKEYLATTKSSQEKVSETDDSVSRTLPLISDTLPSISSDPVGTTQGSFPTKKTCPLFSAIDSLTFAQLLQLRHAHPYKSSMSLPLPQTFLPRETPADDAFKPTFNFADSKAQNCNPLNWLLSYYLACNSLQLANNGSAF